MLIFLPDSRNATKNLSIAVSRYLITAPARLGLLKFSALRTRQHLSQFNSKIWNTARNKVFHGRSYPSPAYLGELASTSESLRKAAERRIADIAGIPHQRPYYRYEDLYRVFFFVEWNTSAPEQQFAADWPQALLASRTAKAELNQVFMEAAPENATFLDYAQSATW